jgi:hypothetical protein
MKSNIYSNMVDATRPLAFIIEQEDINNGVADDCKRCTNAQALLNVPGVADVKVCRTVSYVLFDKDVPRNKWTRYGNGKVSKKVVKANDGGKKELIKPGSALLMTPAASLKKIRERVPTLPLDRNKNKAGRAYGKTGRNSPRLAAWGAITPSDIAKVVNA